MGLSWSKGINQRILRSAHSENRWTTITLNKLFYTFLSFCYVVSKSFVLLFFSACRPNQCFDWTLVAFQHQSVKILKLCLMLLHCYGAGSQLLLCSPKRWYLHQRNSWMVINERWSFSKLQCIIWSHLCSPVICMYMTQIISSPLANLSFLSIIKNYSMQGTTMWSC